MQNDFDFSEKPKGKPIRRISPLALVALLFLGVALYLVTLKLNEPTIDDFAGTWAGLLYQDAGGFSPAYHLELVIYPDDNRVQGTTRISIGDSTPDNSNGIADSYYGIMRFEGEIRDGVLYAREQALIESDVMTGWEWCIKDYELTLNGNTLNGEWHAPQSPGCAPGTVVLERQPDNDY